MPTEMVIPENRRLMPPGFTLRGFSLARCGTLLLSNKYSLLYPLYIHQHLLLLPMPPCLSGAAMSLLIIRFRKTLEV